MAETPHDGRQFGDDLTAYLDGELDEARRAELEARLRDDPALAEELRLLDRTWQLLDALPQTHASQGFADRVMNRAGQLGRRRVRRRRWATLGAAVSAAAAVLVAVVLWRPPPAEPSGEMLANMKALGTIRDYLLADAGPQEEAIQAARIAEELEFVKALDDMGVFANGAAGGDLGDLFLGRANDEEARDRRRSTGGHEPGAGTGGNRSG